MKNIIIFCILLGFITAKSQDAEPSPMNFEWGSSSTPRSLQVDSFPQNNFLTGFQWSGSPKMNHALLNNSAASDEVYWESGTNYSSKRYLMGQPRYIREYNNSQTGYQVGIRNAPAMLWEPTLRIPKNDSTGMFIIREHDPTNAVFGFHHIKGIILPYNEYTDENYNRLKLRKGIDTGLVLNDIWPKPKFMTFEGSSQTVGYQGQKWNLTINLRRYSIDDDDTVDNALVLEIKLPYRTTSPAYRSINFDSLPTTFYPKKLISYPERYDSRGYELLRTGNRDSVLRIYRNMLPVDPGNKDITISAHFLTYDENWINNGDNPSFIGKINIYEKIDSLDIEVRNTGIIDICIDYIKIESDEAYYLSRGAMDSLGVFWYDAQQRDEGPKSFRIYKIANEFPADSADSVNMAHEDFNSIQDVLQSWIARFPSYTLNGVSNNKPLFRFYAQDTESDNPIWWWQQRYYNLLTNGMAVTRDNPYLTKHYEYYTRTSSRYLGIKLDENEHQLANPSYRKNGDNSYKFLGFKWGFMGHPIETINNADVFGDSLKSHFETQFYWNSFHYYDSVINKSNDFNKYKYFLSRSQDGFQPRWEAMLNRIYLLQNKPKSQDFLFSVKPWFLNFFLGVTGIL